MAVKTVKGQVVTRDDDSKQKVTTFSNVNPEAPMETLAEALTLYGSIMEHTPVEIRRQEISIQEV